MLPVVHTLRTCWPQTQLTWIIGSTEIALVERLEGIEFIVFHKERGWRAYRDLARKLNDRSFDGLFLMQIALRAGLASLLVRSPVRMGFDSDRAREGHGLFVNSRIAPNAEPHVIDGFMGFLEACGIDSEDFQYRWTLPEDPLARAWAEELLMDEPELVVISPCSANFERNWRPQRYAAVADHLIEQHGLQVAITSATHLGQVKFANAVCAAMRQTPLNLAGRTNLQQLLSLLRRSKFLLGPDSGPTHMATVANIPAVGLFANTNPRRTGPYRSLQWCIDRYNDAALYRYGQPASLLNWGQKIHDPDVMALITVDEVLEKVDQLLDHLQAEKDSAEVETLRSC